MCLKQKNKSKQNAKKWNVSKANKLKKQTEECQRKRKHEMRSDDLNGDSAVRAWFLLKFHF